MAKFKSENQLWRNRSKHGRDAIFATPDIMWEAATEYFKWCDESPLLSTEIHQGKKIQVPYKRPYTLMGMCLFWGVSSNFLRDFKGSQTFYDNADFSRVISYIEDTIYTQKFDGAAVGQFNANIISRDLGLADKKELNANVNLQDKPIEFD